MQSRRRREERQEAEEQRRAPAGEMGGQGAERAPAGVAMMCRRRSLEAKAEKVSGEGGGDDNEVSVMRVIVVT